MSVDPRDLGVKGEKEWEEFRATFSSHCLLGWLITEVDSVLPDYFGDVQERFWNAFSTAEQFPRPDAKVPLFSHDYKAETLLTAEYARALHEHLFPHSDETGGDVRWWGFGAVVIGFTLALEAYARSVGAVLRRKPLSEAVRTLLKKSSPAADFDSETFNTLVDLEQTRNVLVHRRGIVDDNYIRNVSRTSLLAGELRPLDAAVLDRFAVTVWKTASLIRIATSGPASQA